jgi:hypothetical protein
MIEPAKTFCNFCKNEIKQGNAVVKIALPLPPKLRRDLIGAVEAELTARFKGSPLAGMISVESMLPTTWQLESCTACAYAILPDAQAMVELEVREAIMRRLASQRRSVEAGRELDEALEP